jgi:uncharacterized Zn finger protein (UPF0148 family)
MLKRASKQLDSLSPKVSMASLKKTCHECGMPLSVGVANCSYCGATVGTLFSEANVPAVDAKGKRLGRINESIDFYDRVEKAKERANNSLICALTSFFPLIGLFTGVAAIVLAVMATRALKTHNVEDGRGSATAGLVIGVLGLIAQGGYVVYVIKSGSPLG